MNHMIFNDGASSIRLELIDSPNELQEFSIILRAHGSITRESIEAINDFPTMLEREIYLQLKMAIERFGKTLK